MCDADDRDDAPPPDDEELRRRRAEELRAEIERLKSGEAETPPRNPREFTDESARRLRENDAPDDEEEL
jgi:hypothetical protein